MAGKRSLDNAQRAQICSRWLAGEGQAELAREFGVHRNTISNVIKESGINARMKVGASPGSSEDPKKKKEIANDYSDLGTPEDNPLSRMAWMHKALMLSALHVTQDEAYEGRESERRKELREIGSTMARVFPLDALAAAKKVLSNDKKNFDMGDGPEVRPVAAKPKRTRRKPAK